MPWCLAETRHFLSQYLSTIIEIPWHSLGSDFAVIFLNIFSTSSATKIYLTIAYPTAQSYFHKTNELIYRRFWVYWGQTFVLLLNANFRWMMTKKTSAVFRHGAMPWSASRLPYATSGRQGPPATAEDRRHLVGSPGLHGSTVRWLTHRVAASAKDLIPHGYYSSVRA